MDTWPGVGSDRNCRLPVAYGPIRWLKPRLLDLALTGAIIISLREVMKRHVIKISLAVLVVVGVFTCLLLVLAQDRGSRVSFDFLEGRTSMRRTVSGLRGSGHRITGEAYSFEADFNDLCTKADTELLAKGFSITGPGTVGPFSSRRYIRGAMTSRETDIIIRGDLRIFTRSTPKSSEDQGLDPTYYFHYKYYFKNKYQVKNGWVTVEVWQRRIGLWPPKNLLIRLQLMWHRSTNKSPAQNRNAGAKNGSQDVTLECRKLKYFRRETL